MKKLSKLFFSYRNKSLRQCQQCVEALSWWDSKESPATRSLVLPQETVQISFHSIRVSCFFSLWGKRSGQHRPCFHIYCSAVFCFLYLPLQQHWSLTFRSLPYCFLLSILDCLYDVSEISDQIRLAESFITIHSCLIGNAKKNKEKRLRKFYKTFYYNSDTEIMSTGRLDSDGRKNLYAFCALPWAFNFRSNESESPLFLS